MPTASILSPGRNVWRLAHAERAAFVVDAEDYFRAFVDAACRARQRIDILGWDFHSDILLLEEGGERHRKLRHFLREILEGRPELEIRVLVWDAPLPYGTDREKLQRLRLRRALPSRFTLIQDGSVPFGASHHQKVVVVDDAVAFCGGLDLTLGRWDTRSHIGGDHRRRTPYGDPYFPFHDAMMAMDGAAARAMGELFRDRWRRARGESLPPARPEDDPWPPVLRPDVRDVEIGISRTQPRYRKWSEVREIEALWVDALSAARHTIYIENQYLTARCIGEAIGCKLQEPDGPEVVIVGRRRESAWMEEGVMGVLRHRLVQRLVEADEHGRLRLYHPTRTDLGQEEFINVHAKVLVVDDRLLRIGSSNAANRSMGLDTECDVAIEAPQGREDVSRAIARFRNALVAEHIGATAEAVASAMDQTGSLIEAIRILEGPDRRLVLADTSEPEIVRRLLPEADLVDPDEPLDMETVASRILPRMRTRRSWAVVVKGVPVLLGLLSVIGAWWLTPLREILDQDALLRWAGWLRDHPAGGPMLVVLFVGAGLLLVPVSLLLIVAGLAFPPIPAFGWALAGCLTSSFVMYGIGRVLVRDWLRAIAGRRARAILDWLRGRGLVSMTTLRLIPLAPFSVTNLVAGAARIRLWEYLLGSLLGLIPVVLAFTVVGVRLRVLVRDPSWGNLGILLGLAGAVMAVSWAIHRRGAAARSPVGTGREDGGS